jgi:RNA polymerase sigma-70 factor (ECF subfamily)
VVEAIVLPSALPTIHWHLSRAAGRTLVTSHNPEFDRLFIEHYDRLVRSLTLITGDREGARDAVQDAFVKASARWRAVGRYEDPVGWIRRVAIHRSRDLHRAETRRRRRELRVVSPLDQTQPDRTTTVDGSLRLIDLLRGLPDRQRSVASLFYIEDLPVAEIADALEISTGAVKFHLNRARSALRSAVEREAHPHG